MADAAVSAVELLSKAQQLVPVALERTWVTAGFAGSWKLITSKVELNPSCLYDISGHPLFSKNALLQEQLQSVTKTLSDAISLAKLCRAPQTAASTVGKLQMQSNLDSFLCKLDLNLSDCMLLVKTGVLRDATPPLSPMKRSTELEPSRQNIHIGFH
ncbi:hypothetical protein J5N97_028443 [Dioscorea zingiberensis]|uniref:DUF7032 domain-containing protein n=1 Tax=Dioscorea zingiberensis TaxID=325984 RepID=A0A9D5BYJ7_9LILI|nr:hypothetical protein J5N97_028443 [Dioscorea zingiberensis]